LFDEPDTEQKRCTALVVETGTAAASDQGRVGPSTGELTCTSSERDDITTQPVNTSHRPLSSSHPFTDHICASRHDPLRSNGSSAHITTFQITPTLRQRAFPRTNPAYIGTYRRDRTPAYRRIDCQTTSLGVASELRTTPSPAALNGTRRPTSNGLQRALIQHTGDVVFLSTAGASRVTNSSGHQCTTVLTHQRLSDHRSAAPGVAVRPQSEGGSSALTVSDCRSFITDATGQSGRRVDVMMSATGAVIRRQSEPDYVNIMTRQHQQQQQQQHVAAASGRYYTDDSEWTSELVPSAIYMNQHELTIAGRYTSRSTCNFMDPTANGNDARMSASFQFTHRVTTNQ